VTAGGSAATPDARSVLTRLRDGETLGAEEIGWFARGLASGEVSDAQAGAFAMAACIHGLGEAGRVALTRAMRDSGKVLRWSLDAPVVDKHSTGGIGDCVSLALAPALAACGAYVPMVSGRGLGHTGGTLDKLEAIPGLSTELDEARFREITTKVGCAIVAATSDIAPADRRLYAVRDVTGTVESVDLITASILSKKLAAGLDALVLDVKVGSGAFLPSMEAAETLAEALVAAATGAGCPTRALLTDMNQPLAKSVGNALEVMDVMETLTGTAADPDLGDLCADLGGELLALAGLCETAREGAGLILQSFASGAAAERFQRMVAEMGGPRDFVGRWEDRLPSAPHVMPLVAGESGYVVKIDGRALGLAVVRLGGGRRREGDRVDPAVGLSEVAALGDYVERGEQLALIHARTARAAEEAALALGPAFTVAALEPDLPPTVYRRLG